MDHMRAYKHPKRLIYITNTQAGWYFSLPQIVHMELLQVLLVVVISWLTFGICWAGWWIWGVVNKKKVPYIAGDMLSVLEIKLHHRSLLCSVTVGPNRLVHFP